MGIVSAAKLSSVDLDCTDANGTDNVKRPFYVMNLGVNHDIGLTPIYYIGGSWPNYGRLVHFQPQSGGGVISLDGFFKTLANYTETYGYVTNSSQINPTIYTPAASLVDLNLRINGKQYAKCYCISHSLRAEFIGGNNIIYGNIVYRFSTVENYP